MSRSYVCLIFYGVLCIHVIHLHVLCNAFVFITVYIEHSGLISTIISIYLSIGINVRFAAMMADVGDGLLWHIGGHSRTWKQPLTKRTRDQKKVRPLSKLSGRQRKVNFCDRDYVTELLYQMANHTVSTTFPR